MHPLNPKAFALASGVTWAIGLVFLALIGLFTSGSYGDTVLSFLSTIYKGFRPTIPGALIGGAWGFADGFVGGYLFAWFYNQFAQEKHSG